MEGGRDEYRAKALVIDFTDMEKKKAFLSKIMALKKENIYLDDNLTPAQVAQRKEKMSSVLDAISTSSCAEKSTA